MLNAARCYLGVHLLPMIGSAVGSTPVIDTAKAKSVIYLWMNGGMSHLDTFDPKEKKSVMGPMTSIATKVDGIRVGEHLKHTAQIMDKVCAINSMNSKQGAHEQGSYMMHTSYSMRGTIQHPSLGAWIMKLGGRLNPEIPGYVAINSSPEHTGGGFFGAKYAAAPIGSASEGLKDSVRPSNVSADSFERRLALADMLNKRFHGRYQNQEVKAYEELYREAIKLMNSDDLKAFNINDESAATRELYGDSRFAQGCMLSRRLVEHGVRFVEVQLGGWDTHYDNFGAVQGRCAEFDQAYAGLISDLDSRGLLDETLVVVATEFGRTPEIQVEHDNGRDHHPSAFSCLMAGGGVKRGSRYGETDSKGQEVVDKPVTPQDFNATIAYAMGIPHDQIIMSPSKRPFMISDKGTPVKELFS